MEPQTGGLSDGLSNEGQGEALGGHDVDGPAKIGPR